MNKQLLKRILIRNAFHVLDHPNIARVIDGGSTELGRPYFVMEIVRGEPITTFCDQRKLCLQERMKLFQSVCQAVEHAHQSGAEGLHPSR